MKQIHVEIGGRYTAKVSGRVVPVRVLRMVEQERYSGRDYSGNSRYRTTRRYVCRNEVTGREITCSAARLRRALSQEKNKT